SPPPRVVLIAALAAPLGGALIETDAFRDLIFVVPAVLLSALGLSMLLSVVARRVRYSYVAAGLFIALAGFNGVVLRDALVNGPTWSNDVGLDGMQYGGRQVSAAIRQSLERSPQSTVHLSSSWANGTDMVMRFLLPHQSRFEVDDIDAYAQNPLELTDSDLFVM